MGMLEVCAIPAPPHHGEARVEPAAGLGGQPTAQRLRMGTPASQRALAQGYGADGFAALESITIGYVRTRWGNVFLNLSW